MKTTLKDLKNKEACKGGQKWFINNFGENMEVDIEDLKSKLIDEKEYDYLKWLYENFSLSGVYIDYWNNGNIREKCYYNKGKLDGEYIEYNKIGGIVKERYFENGKLNRMYIEYWYDGIIYKKCFYQDGELDGECIEYNRNGEIIEESYWDKGVKIK
jgi:antitoxin component YwqK of YwqJK toxin-antitoxin module